MLSAMELTAKLGGRWDAYTKKGKARCPSHDDRDPSLDIEEKDGKTLWICRAGCAQADVTAALRAKGCLPEPRANGKAKGFGRVVASYHYVDAEGVLRFKVLRFDPK